MAHSSGKPFSGDELLSGNKLPDGCPVNGDKSFRPINDAEKPINENREHIGGDRLHWHQYIGFVLFWATMTAGQTAINTEISGKDCLVDYVKRNEASPKYHFREGVLLLGFLPVRPRDQVLGGINITIYKNIREEILTVSLPPYYHLITKCYKNKNFTEQSFIGNFESKTHFDWQHIMLSVKNRSLILNGKYLLCSTTLVKDKSVYMVVTPTSDPIYLVPNCKDACPIFRNSLSIMEGISSTVSVANMSVEAGPNMPYINLSSVTTNSGTDLLLSSVTSSWKQLYVKRDKAAVTLKVRNSNMMTRVQSREVSLRGSSVAMVVDCKPATYQQTWEQYRNFINQRRHESTNVMDYCLALGIIDLLLLLILVMAITVMQLQKKRNEEDSHVSKGHTNSGEGLDDIPLQATSSAALFQRQPSSFPPSKMLQENEYAELTEDDQEEHPYCYVDLEALKKALEKEKASA